MLNMVTIVGRFVGDPTVEITESGKERCFVTVAVPRSYKNSEGVYETDFVDCVLWNGVAQKTAEYCKQGDLVGIKGKVETYMSENENGEKRKITQIIAEKVSFLSTSKEVEKDAALQM